jgi:hypothetical protein
MQLARVNVIKNVGFEVLMALHHRFLLGLLFDLEDGGDMFLRNVGSFSTDYTALYPKR